MTEGACSRDNRRMQSEGREKSNQRYDNGALSFLLPHVGVDGAQCMNTHSDRQIHTATSADDQGCRDA